MFLETEPNESTDARIWTISTNKRILTSAQVSLHVVFGLRNAGIVRQQPWRVATCVSLPAGEGCVNCSSHHWFGTLEGTQCGSGVANLSSSSLGRLQRWRSPGAVVLCPLYLHQTFVYCVMTRPFLVTVICEETHPVWCCCSSATGVLF